MLLILSRYCYENTKFLINWYTKHYCLYHYSASINRFKIHWKDKLQSSSNANKILSDSRQTYVFMYNNTFRLNFVLMKQIFNKTICKYSSKIKFMQNIYFNAKQQYFSFSYQWHNVMILISYIRQQVQWYFIWFNVYRSGCNMLWSEQHWVYWYTVLHYFHR